MGDFDPGIVEVEVPAGAEAGARVPVPLPKGQTGFLTVPADAKAGDKFEVRPTEVFETVTVEVSKSAPTLKEMQELRVGVTLTGNDWEQPVVTEPVAEEGRAFGKLQRGDVLTRVTGNNAKGAVDQETRGSLKTAALLKDCIGPVTITVKRPVPSAVAIVKMKGFLHKRSPKSFAGIHAWQQRWFELTTTKLTYFEVVLRESEQDFVSVAVAVEKGVIPLSELAGVRAVASGKGKARLDLLRSDSRIFQMMAPSPPEREQWVKAINEAIMAGLAAAAEGAAVSEPKAAPAEPAAEAKPDAGGDDMEAVDDAGDAAAEPAEDAPVEARDYSVSIGSALERQESAVG